MQCGFLRKIIFGVTPVNTGTPTFLMEIWTSIAKHSGDRNDEEPSVGVSSFSMLGLYVALVVSCALDI